MNGKCTVITCPCRKQDNLTQKHTDNMKIKNLKISDNTTVIKNFCKTLKWIKIL